jgi:hypothetical protein
VARFAPAITSSHAPHTVRNGRIRVRFLSARLAKRSG